MTCEKINCQSLANIKAEGVRMLQFLRALGTEDQRIAYAVLEGMQLQKQLDAQRATDKNTETQHTGRRA